MDAGADVNAAASYYNGQTALAAASAVGNIEVVEVLVAAGADVSLSSGNKHQTAIETAMAHDHIEVASLLRAAQAATKI